MTSEAMAKFLNTSATNYFLEELIKAARDRLILISPFLRLNTRVKELLEDKNRLKIDVRIVYGKNELQPEEINWLRELDYIRTSFCKNLHAKCYLNEENCIISSLNLYEFSQINNNEMGVLIQRSDDSELYKDAYEEAQRIIRISDEVRMSLEKVEKEPENSQEQEKNSGKLIISKLTQKPELKTKEPENTQDEASLGKLTTSKLAQKLGLRTKELLDKLTAQGYVEWRDEKHLITAKGKEAGGEFRTSKYGPYFLWPEDLSV